MVQQAEADRQRALDELQLRLEANSEIAKADLIVQLQELQGVVDQQRAELAQRNQQQAWADRLNSLARRTTLRWAMRRWHKLGPVCRHDRCGSGTRSMHRLVCHMCKCSKEHSSGILNASMPSL